MESMKNKFYILIINALLINNIFCQTNLCLIDTSQNEIYIYQPTIKILEKTGFNCTYLPIAKILDEKKNLNLKKYSAIFFIICSEFLNSLQSKNSATSIMLDLINNELSTSNKLISFFLPPNATNISSIESLLEILKIHVNTSASKFNCYINKPNFNVEIFTNFIKNQSIFSDNIPTILSKFIKIKISSSLNNKLIIPPLENNSNLFLRFDDNFYFAPNNPDLFNQLFDLATFTTLLNSILSEPLEAKFRNYNTSISKPNRHQNNNFCQNSNYKNITVIPLPITRSSTNPSLAPHGIYWYNPQGKNHIFIASNSILSFAGISENFHLIPLCKKTKEKLIQEAAQLFTELHHIAKNIPTFQNQIHKKSEQKGINFQNVSIAPNIRVLNPNSNNNQKRTKVAWMEIDIFKNEKEIQKQNLLIDYIYKSGINYLWISLAPNMYFSPIGWKQKEIEVFLKTISRFTKTLKERNTGLTYPKILVGFEIANNLHGDGLPKIFSTDLYGNEYTDIPAPLNNQFWENEIIIPLKKLSQYWQDKKISNGIPISGFVIDLEMYLRKKCGTFLSTMGFDTETFNKFSHKKLHNMSVQDYLINHNLLQSYYSFLSNKSIALGKKLKNEFKNACPSCNIACYAPNIYPNWFYKGLYQGLSDEKHPIMLFTFNTEFLGHQNWLQKNKIYVKHFKALMLSKIQSKDDFIHSKGDVWINRFSRFIDEKIPGAWYTNEQSTLRKENIPDFLNYLNEH